MTLRIYIQFLHKGVDEIVKIEKFHYRAIIKYLYLTM